MTESEFRTAIYDWLFGELAIPVIFADQDGTQPAETYATIRIMFQVQVGNRDELRSVDSDGIQSLYGVRQATVSFEIYGTGAFDYMQDAQNSLSKPSVINNFNVSGISIVSREQIVNLTERLETKFEDRAQMDVLFYYAQEYEDDVGLIENVEVNDQIVEI